jgi:hypothetical protein
VAKVVGVRLKLKKLCRSFLGAGVGKIERAFTSGQVEYTFDSPQDAAEVVDLVIDVTSLRRVGGDHDQRHSKTQLIALLVLILVGIFQDDRCQVIEPACPVILRNEDGGVLPVADVVVASRAVAKRVNNRCYPSRSLPRVNGWSEYFPSGITQLTAASSQFLMSPNTSGGFKST